MPTYELVKFEQVRSNDKGKSLRLALKNGDGFLKDDQGNPLTPELWVAAGKPDPTIGQVTGEVVFNEQWKRWDFKPEKQGGGGGWGGGKRQSDPLERASIEAQVGAKIAAQLIVELAKVDKLAVVNDPGFPDLFDRLTESAWRSISRRSKP
jgi:hypothetical protein